MSPIIEKMRQELGKPKAAFAKDMGVSRTTYYDMINDKCKIPGKTVVRLWRIAFYKLRWSHERIFEEFKRYI